MSKDTQGGGLENKVAFVAGASSGINLAIAHAFCDAGVKVAIISRSEEKITAAAKQLQDAGGEAIGMAADVRDFDAVETALRRTNDQFGAIDIVLSGAAGNFVAPALGMSANGFKAVVDIDLLGTFNVLRASFEHLNRPGASLVSITAPQAVIPSAFQSHVCAAKAGVNMLTKCLALEWGPHGVRVNAVSPGPIDDTGRDASPGPQRRGSSGRRPVHAARAIGNKVRSRRRRAFSLRRRIDVHYRGNHRLRRRCQHQRNGQPHR